MFNLQVRFFCDLIIFVGPKIYNADFKFVIIVVHVCNFMSNAEFSV
jgi:hypothetical protein